MVSFGHSFSPLWAATMAGLTEKQADFVRHLVRDGCTQTESARRAGYGDPSSRAYELVRKPHVIEAIRQEQRRLVDGDLVNVALKTLRDIMSDTDASAAARVSAARAALEIGGHMRKDAADDSADKALSEMSIEELEALVRHGREQLAMSADESQPN